MKLALGRCFVFAFAFALLCCLASRTALAQQTPPPAAAARGSGIEESIFNPKPSFLVAAQVNRTTAEYREGDALSIKLTSEEDAYVYVLYQTAAGEVYQVFPNRVQRNNRVRARQTVELPGDEDMFRWIVGPPYGKEVIKVIATKEPVDILSKPELSKGRFNAVNPRDLKGIEVELGEDQPIRWGETDVAIQTRQDARTEEEREAKRFGVFFGVSKHAFNDILMRGRPEGVSESKARRDLPSCHRDAQKLAQAMREIGRLNEVKLYTNEMATKANMRDAITKWLPSVSRPGDTVVIYFSGHSGQMKDLSGDEADGMDEYLVPHDLFTASEYNALGRLHKQGKLTQEETALFHSATKMIQSLGPEAGLELIQRTAVTDDLLARWVQRLEGRQVVFISDSCHSAGFADDERNFSGAKGAFEFDLMAGEASRLKGLGQGDHAIFSAAYANELALVRRTADLSVMTYSILQFLERSSGPQKLEDCFRFCDEDMRKYFEEWNRLKEQAGDKDRVKPSHPFLLNHCQRPVFLKP